ncbi:MULTISPECIES: DUF6520 family protein [unclassified Chryseobacterium]|uniref:DUF6520 family protein n=1 Tax=unclassified Chryseobacterium TaxID=2593645 RepID=UPI001AE00E35|nr:MULTISPECIES: DUF6520 family protein [unclassified Chryseobacterium]
MKNIFFSALVVLIGTGAAFATQKANNSKSKSTIVKGYHFDNAQNLCIETEQDCSTVFDENMCTWGVSGPQLREIGPTGCAEPLYRVPEN